MLYFRESSDCRHCFLPVDTAARWNVALRVAVTENWSGAARTLYSIGSTTTASETRVVSRYALFNDTRVEMRLEAYYTKK